VGFTIESISGLFNTATKPADSSNETGDFQNRLGVRSSNSAAAKVDADTPLTPDKLAARDATIKLSNSVSNLNTKEYFTTRQLGIVSSLLATAKEIQRETNPERAASLAGQAQGLVSHSNAQFNDAVATDPTLAQDEGVQIKVDSRAPYGSSSGDFSTLISSVTSFDTLGIDGSLSFNQADISGTIDTLEAAQSGLSVSLASYASTRSDISTEIQIQSAKAQLGADSQSQPSIEKLASDAAKKISKSTQSLLANNRVEQLDVTALLADE
jgi:hypothetical protein